MRKGVLQYLAVQQQKGKTIAQQLNKALNSPLLNDNDISGTKIVF